MKKLLLITSLIPLSLSPTIGLCTSCNGKGHRDKPFIDDNNIQWNYLKYGAYEHLVEPIAISDSLTQDEALERYLDDVNTKHFIFLDDLMTFFNAAWYTTKAEGYSFSKFTVALKFNDINRIKRLFSYSLDYDIVINSRAEVIAYAKSHIDVVNMEINLVYEDAAIDGYVQTARRWDVHPVFAIRNFDINYLNGYFHALDSRGISNWSITGNYEIKVPGEPVEKVEVNLDRSNYTVATNIINAKYSLIHMLYSNYLFQTSVKEDFRISGFSFIGNKPALQCTNTEKPINFNQNYIAKLEFTNWPDDVVSKKLVVNLSYTQDKKTYFVGIIGLSFITINSTKTILSHSWSSSEYWLSAHNIEGIKKDDIVYTSFYVIGNDYNQKELVDHSTQLCFSFEPLSS